jgi:hypothetical protein
MRMVESSLKKGVAVWVWFKTFQICACCQRGILSVSIMEEKRSEAIMRQRGQLVHV